MKQFVIAVLLASTNAYWCGVKDSNVMSPDDAAECDDEYERCIHIITMSVKNRKDKDYKKLLKSYPYFKQGAEKMICVMPSDADYYLAKSMKYDKTTTVTAMYMDMTDMVKMANTSTVSGPPSTDM